MTAAACMQELAETFARDVREGLARMPKSIPPMHFYDAEGSRLFDEITRTPEYYPTETERAILESHASEILDAVGPAPLDLIEFGAGSGDKTRTIIRAALARQDLLAYYPIDVSGEALDATRDTIGREFPRASVLPVNARNRQGLASLSGERGARRLLLFLGSSIGNFSPADAEGFLRDVAAEMRPEDALLLGVDHEKDPRVLHAAYNDAAGVTARFNLNLLARVNRELEGDFDLDAFEHRAFYNAEAGRVEMHLVSRRAQRVRVRALGIEVDFQEGETIHTENSHKFTPEGARALAERAGLRVEARWQDARAWFGLLLLRRATP